MQLSYTKLRQKIEEKQKKDFSLNNDDSKLLQLLTDAERGKVVSMHSIYDVCQHLACGVDDLLEEQAMPQPKKQYAGVADESAETGHALRIAELFAGIGGIRLGFEQAFKHPRTVFVSEWDKAAQLTYQANYKDEFSIAGDITQIKEEDIPSFDICLAGFPCQAFSLAGKRLGFNDDYHGLCRGTLFMDVARICDYHQPKVIFCENVKGLVSHDRGNTFEVIKKTFSELGYQVYSKVLNSKDFGVPQNRERIYIVAFRKDIDSTQFTFPSPTKTDSVIADILEEQEVPVKYYLSTTYIDTLRKHKERHAAKGNGFGYEIRPLDGIAGAIVCGGMGRERNLIVDHRLTNFTPTTKIKGEVNREGIRKMTPREWARLQGYPDSYKLPIADVHLYKQLGNTVTVPVIAAIAKQIKKVLNHG